MSTAQQSRRVDAAARAYNHASTGADDWEDTDRWTAEERTIRLGEMSAALAAADAVMFSDEAIERVAVALWNHDFPSHPISDVAELLEWTRVRRLEQARLMVAALKGDQ
ncbi:hypothetical protein ACIPY0_13390 [Paenarthrobacter nicotinovorans]|uniref:hypothetical protein n=1 Tax=Paenarthrobacter nicotinovorans TaxID=29320 RepID=UPI00381D0FB1